MPDLPDLLELTENPNIKIILELTEFTGSAGTCAGHCRSSI
jgi:hypothetical protein